MPLDGTPLLPNRAACSAAKIPARTRRGENATEDMVQVILALAIKLFEGGVVTSKFIRERFGVSSATAKRYMLRLERGLPVRVVRVEEGHVMTLPEEFRRARGRHGVGLTMQ